MCEQGGKGAGAQGEVGGARGSLERERERERERGREGGRGRKKERETERGIFFPIISSTFS